MRIWKNCFGMSRKNWSEIFIIALCISVVPSLVSGQTLSERMDKYLTDLNAKEKFNGSIIVTRGDDVLLSKGYGFADAEHKVANSPETRFRIGSMTKQFTSMAIMILQEQGKLKVTDTLGKHISGIPDEWKKLTVHQLLTHTSGIMHSWSLSGFVETMMVPASLDEVLKRFYDKPLLFTPGEGFQYSGVGYFVLAKLIEVESGKSYDEFLQENIFIPLGMSSTGSDHPEVILEKRARGYIIVNGRLNNAPTLYIPILTGGGNLYSTVEDMAQWDRALRNKKLISQESYNALYRPERNNYAYGWMVAEKEGLRVLNHSGGVPGFSSNILRIPEKKICVAVMTNVTPCDVGTITNRLAKMVLENK